MSGNTSGTNLGKDGTPTGPRAEIGFLGKIGGRKFILAVVGVLAVALHRQFAWIDPNDVLTIGGIIATYIIGQSISDGMSAGATSTTTPVSDPAEVSRIDHATELARNETAKTEVIGQALRNEKLDRNDVTNIISALNK